MSEDRMDAMILQDVALWSKKIMEALNKKGIRPSQFVICVPFILGLHAYVNKIQDIEGFAESVKKGIIICHEALQEWLNK